MRRILFLGTQMAFGGAQNVLLTQAEWFHNKGDEVVAVFIYDKDDLEGRWRDRYPFPIINLKGWIADGNALTNYIRLIWGLKKLFFVLLFGRFDIVETFTPHSDFLGIPLAWLARVPVRIASHHGPIESAPKWLARVNRFIVNRGIASKLVAVSQQVLEDVVANDGVKEERVLVIRNGIILPQKDDHQDIRDQIFGELGISNKNLLVLSVGRVVWQKGFQHLFEAIPRVLEGYGGVTFAIAGDGYMREDLYKTAVEKGFVRSVILLGNRFDTTSLLAAADLFVLPSLWEGLPLAILEAMSAGCPVIATDVGGVKEVIIDGQNGIVVPPADPAALAEALLRLLKNKKERERFAEAAMERVRSDFSAERMCQEYDVLFMNLSNPMKNG
jgi:glycosyltransferase involved in cell wall biosynthesis